MKRSLTTTLAIMTAAVLANVWVFAVPPGTDDEISARLQPFGQVCRSGDDCGVVVADSGSGAMSGQQVYDKFCFICHAAAVGGAPLFGDAASWQPRIAKGMDAMMATTLSGLNAMPPRGTCMACSDEELSAAVTYMVEQAR